MERKDKKMKIKANEKVIMGSWNARGTYEEGALKNLAKTLSNIDAIALQETRQKVLLSQK